MERNGLSNKFFDILIVSLEFRASFTLFELPAHRGVVEIALRRPRLHFLAQRLHITNATVQTLRREAEVGTHFQKRQVDKDLCLVRQGYSD